SGEVGKGIYDVFAHLGTRLSRTFDVGGRHVDKIRHSVEPEVGYLYIPREDQSDLPQFDRLDRIEATNRLRYALTNRLTARLDSKSGARYHEFLYLRLS
ncbi:MAG: LPS-assembly protein LptD, partial [Desulfuromonadales bacterium]|nr:LPS-assembly protein LptD [Desulfuromonadales bacterium]NIS39944.1 LPS-assembly protein LptD [Desulfuromonadales bacterium]